MRPCLNMYIDCQAEGRVRPYLDDAAARCWQRGAGAKHKQALRKGELDLGQHGVLVPEALDQLLHLVRLRVLGEHWIQKVQRVPHLVYDFALRDVLLDKPRVLRHAAASQPSKPMLQQASARAGLVQGIVCDTLCAAWIKRAQHRGVQSEGL